MSKYRKVGVCLLLCTFMLAGCGQAKLPEAVEVDTIAVDKEGVVNSYLVRDFDKDYYEIEGLRTMAIEEAAEYNTANAKGNDTPVVVENVDLITGAGTRARVEYTYSSADAFSDFSGNELFYGTVEYAVASGAWQSTSLVSVKDKTEVTADYVTEKASGNHVIITDAKAMIYCPYAVTHISEGAVLNEDGSVDPSLVDGECVILMKK